MKTTLLIECKKFCLKRCLMAMVVCIGLQFLHMEAFLLCVNFSLLHPLEWLTQTLAIIMSIYTWLLFIPLMAVVILYTCVYGRTLLAAKYYYETRFKLFVNVFPSKVSFLCLRWLIAFLTAWLYSGYLPEEYNSITYKHQGKKYLNFSYIYLLGGGITITCLQYIKTSLMREDDIKFPLIQENNWVRMSSLIYPTLYKSFLRSALPNICYTIIYWLFISCYMGKVSKFLGMSYDEPKYTYRFFTMLTNIQLLMYNWILMTVIQSSFRCIRKTFCTFLTEETGFVIEKPPLMAEASSEEVCLVDALAMKELPIMQSLAAQYFCNIGSSSIPSKRSDIYILSIPGNHPYNWNQISAQCLLMINNFTKELKDSISTISTIKRAEMIHKQSKSISPEDAQKILSQQYNKMHNIRNAVVDNTPLIITPEQKELCTRREYFNRFLDYVCDQFDMYIKNLYFSIPTIPYLFIEPEGAKTAYLLSNSQIIIWIMEGLVGICTASLKEDRYGIVQTTLPQIIESIVQLKKELDILHNVMLNGEKINRNLFGLRGTVKHCLYRIATDFGDYLDDLNIDDPFTLRILRCCLSYQDI